MLHEILLALMGHPGSIIVPVTADHQVLSAGDDDLDEDDVVAFEVAHGIEFIPAGEKQLLNQIVVMGFYYRCIERFIESHQSLRVSAVSFNMRRFSLDDGDNNNNGGGDDDDDAGNVGVRRQHHPGLYVRALCVGLDEFLDGYRAALLKTEQDILAEPHHQYPLAKLRVALRDYAVILPHLKELINEVQGRSGAAAGTLRGHSLHGGEILQRLYRRSLVGIPYVQACMKRLLFHCNSVLFHQISAWVVNGLITDPYDEFFVEDRRDAHQRDGGGGGVGAGNGGGGGGGGSVGGSGRRGGGQSSAGASVDDRSSMFSMRTAASGSSAGGTSVGDVSHYDASGTKAVNWNVCFQLRDTMLPTAFFPLALARKILFVGRSVCILEHAKANAIRSHISVEAAGGTTNPQTQTQTHAPLLPHSDALSFARAIHNLREKPSFDLLSVNQAVDAMRVCVNKHLWHLVVVEARLYEHLQALKDFYLLGRGEFYQSFIEAVDERGMFDIPPSQKVERDINDGPFQIAAQQLSMEDDPFFARLVVRLDKTSFVYPHFGSKDVCRYGEAGVANVTVVNGVAARVERSLRVTSTGASQIGAVWYDARKTVSRGFSTKFRWQLAQRARSATATTDGANRNQLSVRVREVDSSATASVSGKASPSSSSTSSSSPSSASSKALPWSWGEGFSFVVQNFSLLATPVVSRATNVDIRTASTTSAGGEGGGGGGGRQVRYGYIKGGLTADTRVTVVDELTQSSSSSNSKVAFIAGVAIDRHHGDAVRNDGVVNSLEVYFHVSPTDPTSNHVCVYARPPPRDGGHGATAEAPSRLLAHSQAAAMSGDGRTQLSQAALAHLSDGQEHVVKIVYKQPMHVPGMLTVFVDDLDTPALVLNVDLESFMKLDDGRAYVGFTAVNGYTSLSPTRREARSTGGAGVEYARDIVAWEFTEAEGVSANAWRKIRLQYSVEAPIDLILLNDDFDRYNALFSFLFLAKRTQLKLQNTWPLLMHLHRPQETNGDAAVAAAAVAGAGAASGGDGGGSNASDNNGGSAAAAHDRKMQLLRPVTSLRHNMQFFIDNLQYYLQVDVLEVQHAALLKRIDDSKDFESVTKAHQGYLSRLTNLCFRSDPNVSRCLNRIFDVVLEFCALVHSYVSRPPPASAQDDAEDNRQLLGRIAELTDAFEKQAAFLYLIIGPQASSYTAPHLAQLVLRLDFNRFFSEKSAFLRATNRSNNKSEHKQL